jgi:hypothetical protein
MKDTLIVLPLLLTPLMRYGPSSRKWPSASTWMISIRVDCVLVLKMRTDI